MHSDWLIPEQIVLQILFILQYSLNDAVIDKQKTVEMSEVWRNTKRRRRGDSHHCRWTLKRPRMAETVAAIRV